ncbi:MAG: (2Fe-2S)-binding protein [Candidatus Babeliales bacterium]
MKSPLLQKPDYLICTCMGVMYSEIVDAIAHGADSFEKLKEQLGVGTGCSSCVAEVYEILMQEKSGK